MAILGRMIPLPKPRGFWDYALFALIMTGALVFIFWLDASDEVGWADAALALAAAVLFVFAIILARRGEKATWIAQPTWHAYLLAVLGGFTLMFGAIYADAYLLHRRDLTSTRLWNDMVLAIVLIAGMVWSSRRRTASKASVVTRRLHHRGVSIMAIFRPYHEDRKEPPIMSDTIDVRLTLTRDKPNSMNFRDTYDGLNDIWYKFDVDAAGNLTLWANADGFEHLARYFWKMARTGKNPGYHAHHSLEFGGDREPGPELTIAFANRPE